MICLNCLNEMNLVDKVRNVVEYHECNCGVQVAVYGNEDIPDQWALIPGKPVTPGRLSMTRGITKGV